MFAGSGCLVARTSSRIHVGVGRVSGRSRALGGSGRGREAWKEGRGAPASWNPGTPRRGPMSALGSPSDPAMPYLPPLQPGQERPRLAPGPRKRLEARDQRTRGNGRSLRFGAQPIRRREGGDGPGCRVHPAAAGGSRGLRSGGRRLRGRGRGARFPGVPRGGPRGAPALGTPVPGRGLASALLLSVGPGSNALLRRWRLGHVPPGRALPRPIGLR